MTDTTFRSLTSVPCWIEVSELSGAAAPEGSGPDHDPDDQGAP